MRRQDKPRGPDVVWQIVILLAVAGGIAYLAVNLADNLEQRAIRTGYGFLDKQAGFEIGESLIPYSGTSTYGRALLVGLLNTLAVSAAAILFATVLGVLLGIARLSHNPLLGGIAGLYIEAIRNVPLLLQLFLWYAALTELLPSAQAAVQLLPGFYLSKGGLNFPLPVWQPAYAYAAYAFAGGIAVMLAVRRAMRRSRARRGGSQSAWIVLALPLCAAVAAFLLTGGTVALDTPVLRRFGFSGGGEWSPELTALLFGLIVYSTAFIAEIVRSGIQSVPRGQREAALALGLRRGQAMRLVILPQAMRVAIPPLATQYLSLTKNSSLASAIGYPDLMSVANTTLNQTGQALEVIALTTSVYLAISLLISLAMNRYNARITRQGAA